MTAHCNDRTAAARRLSAYAVLALPLAMAVLPLYVHAPRLYAGLGLELGIIGALLLAVRVLDAVSDPLLGAAADRVPERFGGRRLAIGLAVPVLALGMVLVFNPPAGGNLAAWFAVSLVLVHAGLSAASISYFAIGSALSGDYHARTRITAARGAVGLIGVLLAAVMPEILARTLGAESALGWLGWGYVPLLAASAAVMLVWAPRPERSAIAPALHIGALMAPLSNPAFRPLALVFLANGVAVAIPATLVLFYVSDVLGRADLAGAFLALYFLCGAAGMPLWLALSRRAGKARAWLAAMALSVAAFVWAGLLGPGDAAAFGVVCALSGLALGADLALPASLLADVIDHDRAGGAARPDGAYFGMWHLLEKLSLALAAGFALPLLDAMGYQPGAAGAHTALAVVYALVPCGIKALAAALLLASGIDRRPDATPQEKGGMA